MRANRSLLVPNGSVTVATRPASRFMAARASCSAVNCHFCRMVQQKQGANPSYACPRSRQEPLASDHASLTEPQRRKTREIQQRLSAPPAQPQSPAIATPAAPSPRPAAHSGASSAAAASVLP